MMDRENKNKKFNWKMQREENKRQKTNKHYGCELKYQ